MKMERVIGLEVHCQLATASKLFCGCSASASGAVANTAICPVCTGQPGALPVLNSRAVELAFSAALALECRLRPRSVFARKNYFYPDLPKAYQISQYDEPFSEHGGLNLPGDPPRRIGIRRIHMEEDAGKLVHEVGSEELGGSLVDFNRSGVPLIEIVSEPDLRSADEAWQYLTALKGVLQYSGASNCDMEKGEMRCDANVSVRRAGATGLGTRAEVKNMNSFRAVKEAVAYEFRRQREVVASGGKVLLETRQWDAARGVTEAMRSKEEAHDYRYLPEPDLVPLTARPALVESLRKSLPELPAARRARYAASFALSDYDAAILSSEKALGDYFDEGLRAFSEPAKAAKPLANLLTTDLLGKLNADKKGIERSPVTAEMLASIVGMSLSGRLSTKLAKEVLAKSYDSGKDPASLVDELGLVQVTDEAQLMTWVDAALSANPKAASDLRGGKAAAIGALVGSVMKQSKGKANPETVNRLIQERIHA